MLLVTVDRDLFVRWMVAVRDRITPCFTYTPRISPRWQVVQKLRWERCVLHSVDRYKIKREMTVAVTS